MTRDLATSLLVLDTNILVHVVRGSEFGRGLDKAYGIRARAERPLISRVVVAEMLSLVEQFGWGDMKRERLTALLGDAEAMA